MSALGQKQICAAHGLCPPRAKGGSHFKDHATGFWSSRRSARPPAWSRYHRRGQADRCALSGGISGTEARYVQVPSNPFAV